MKSVQRLEIIVERGQRERILAVLEQAGVDGWSVLPVISGHGQRGDRGLDGLPGSLENDLILSTIDDAHLTQALEKLRPVLERWGGVCLVSEARWLKHESPKTAP